VIMMDKDVLLVAKVVSLIAVDGQRQLVAV
jgi:hypothetical protein